MKLTRRQFMTGLATTTAIVAVPFIALKPRIDPKQAIDRVFYGMDFGSSDMAAISRVRINSDGVMVVESIEAFDFYKQPSI